MSESFAERRVRLARQITGQRQELAEAYRDLGKPLHYAQTGIKGLQMLKQNAWLVALAPSVIGLVTTLLGLRNKEKPKPGLFDFFKKKSAAGGKKEEEAGAALRRKARPLLSRIMRHSVTAFKLYRRVRPFIPL